MELLELILFLLVAVVISSLLDQMLRGVSLPLVQILLGIIIALILPLPSSLGLDAELLLILFIAPLHFNESRHVDSGELYRNRFGIISLVTGLVLVTMIAVGITLNALIPAIPLAAALAFGAAMGSTDAAAVTSLAKEMRFGQRHEALLNGEALFNDVTGTIGFQCAIAVVVAGGFSLVHAGEEFTLEFFGGAALGIALGLVFWGLNHLMHHFGFENPTVHVVLELLTPFIIFLIGEQLHVGGVIAVVMAGMTISLLPHRQTAATSHQRLQASNVWKTLEFMLNGIIFVLLGTQLPNTLLPAIQGDSVEAWLLLAVALILTLVLEAVRFVWILGLDIIHARKNGIPVRSCFTTISLKGTLGMAFAGPKGGITLALTLTIPATIASGDAFPLRTELLFLTSGVIVCTMLLANFAVRKLVPLKPHEKRTKGYADPEIALLTNVIASIQADAHKTGAVTGEEARLIDKSDNAASDTNTTLHPTTTTPEAISAIARALPDEVDEPATAIVMKRYADRIENLLPLASNDVAKQARVLVKRCDSLYDQVNAYSDALADIQKREDINSAGMQARLLAVQNVNDTVDDIQDAALARELMFIKRAQRSGELSDEYARELRNDVYVQRMVIS